MGVVEKYLWLASIGYCGSGLALTATTFLSVMLKEHGYHNDAIGNINSSFDISVVTFMPLVLTLTDAMGSLRYVLTALVALSGALLVLACMVPDGVSASVFTCAFLVVLSPAPRLWDRTVLHVLGSEESSDWGMYRNMQSIFFGAGAPLCGWLKERFGWIVLPIQFAVGYVWICVGAFYYHVLTRTTEATAHRRLDDGTPQREDEELRVSNTGVIEGIREGYFRSLRGVGRRILEDSELRGYLVVQTMLGVPFAVIMSFLPVFMNDLGASSVLIGFSTAATVSTEAIVFSSGRWILRRFRLDVLYGFGLCCMVLRLTGYALIQRPWEALLLDVLHGGSFALTWLVCVELYTTRFPETVATTAFGVLSMFAWGLGPMVGNIGGGQLSHHMGLRWLFAGAAGWTVATIIIFAVVVLRKEKGPPKAKSSLEESCATQQQTSEVSPLLIQD